MRSARASLWRTTTGPSRAPAKSPTASGATADQATGAEQAEAQRGGAVRDAEDGVLERVAAGERVVGQRHEQREEHDSGRRAEVAAVDADQEDAADRARRRAGPVLAGAAAPTRRPQQDGQGGRADQPRRDPLERVRRRDQQQPGADAPAGTAAIASARTSRRLSP